MSGGTGALRSAHRLGYRAGLVLCAASAALAAALVLSEAVAPGAANPGGLQQEVGYLLTGLVFLAAAWVWWRSGRALETFSGLPEGRRPAAVLRECLLYSGALLVSSFCGLAYWALVGRSGVRHVWGFILLGPVLFLALVPQYERWAKQLKG